MTWNTDARDAPLQEMRDNATQFIHVADWSPSMTAVQRSILRPDMTSVGAPHGCTELPSRSASERGVAAGMEQQAPLSYVIRYIQFNVQSRSSEIPLFRLTWHSIGHCLVGMFNSKLGLTNLAMPEQTTLRAWPASDQERGERRVRRSRSRLVLLFFSFYLFLFLSVSPTAHLGRLLMSSYHATTQQDDV